MLAFVFGLVAAGLAFALIAELDDLVEPGELTGDTPDKEHL